MLRKRKYLFTYFSWGISAVGQPRPGAVDPDIDKPAAHSIQEEMINAVNAATSELMQMILHYEAFWRVLYFLVSRLETASQLNLFILDVAKTELAADLTAADDLCSTGLALFELLYGG